MRKRYLFIISLMLTVWVAAGAFVGANEKLLTFTNKRNANIQVEVFNQRDPIRLIACKIIKIAKGDTTPHHVENEGWLSCGDYETFFVQVMEEVWDYNNGIRHWKRILQRENVHRGTTIVIE